jgi:putative phosphoribosyl transferase
VDDGIATGATMIAAVRAVRQLGPARVIVAAPVIAASTKALLEAEADDVECVEAPEHFLAVGAWYQHFDQTSDAEVETLLRQPTGLEKADAPVAKTVAQTLEIPAPGGVLTGDLTVPHGAVALVVFAHGSGSSRLSPRNRDVAAELQKRGFATLLFDLLTPEEESVDQYTAEFRFDLPRLARRLVAVTDWIAIQDKARGLPIGYFGASTGAAAALIAASARPNTVHAVVSRGGRPDLADAALEHVLAPTLLVVGGNDREVQTLNRNARHQMRNAHVELVIVPGASHLFEEPGTLGQVIRTAADWFETYLALPAPALAGGAP